jgi:hypothetical protein
MLTWNYNFEKQPEMFVSGISFQKEKKPSNAHSLQQHNVSFGC